MGDLVFITKWNMYRPLLFGLLISLTSIGFLTGSCALNPVTKRPNLVLTTTEGERNIGEKAAREIEESVGLTKDPQLTAYVESVGQRLAAHSPRRDVEYHFYVVEMVEPNAFALPGGFVYVSRGLLALANSEDELANVIGHEIGHVAARHAVQRMSAAAPFAIVGGVAGAVTGIVSDRLSNLVTGITGFTSSLLLSPYSREQEREADKVGIEMAAAAGWDPGALSSFLHTLERHEELQLDGPRKTSFFDSHPATPERVSITTKYARKVPGAKAQPIAGNRSAFLAKLDGLVVGQHPANGVFVKNLFLQPDLDFAVRFPNDWETQNTRQAVLAIKKNHAVFSLLQVAAQGDDPMIGLRTLNEKVAGNLLENAESFKVDGLPAVRIVLQSRTKQGPTAVDLTWIAHKGLVYQIIASCPLDQYENYSSIFSEIVQSFRHSLTSAEQARITITRLRLVQAREKETLAQFLLRTESVWNVDEAAVANGLSRDVTLRQGQLVKIAKRERYLPATVKN